MRVDRVRVEKEKIYGKSAICLCMKESDEDTCSNGTFLLLTDVKYLQSFNGLTLCLDFTF